MQLLILSNLTPRSAPDDYFLPSRSRTGRGDCPTRWRVAGCGPWIRRPRSSVVELPLMVAHQ